MIFRLAAVDPTAKAIDEYIERRNAPEDGTEPIDPRLIDVVERMFERCFADSQFRQAIGVALETRRLDKLEEAVTKRRSRGEPGVRHEGVPDAGDLARVSRGDSRALVKMYETSSAEIDHLNVCQCLMFLDDAEGVAAILTALVDGEEDDRLLAYQIAFVLHENEIQAFLDRVAEKLPAADDVKPETKPEGDAADADATKPEGGEKSSSSFPRRRAPRCGRCSPAKPPWRFNWSFCSRTTTRICCC